VEFALKVINWDQNTEIRLQLWDIAGSHITFEIFFFFFFFFLLLFSLTHCIGKSGQERFGTMTRVCAFSIFAACLNS
jgi:hypothetical protein